MFLSITHCPPALLSNSGGPRAARRPERFEVVTRRLYIFDSRGFKLLWITGACFSYINTGAIALMGALMTVFSDGMA